MSLFNKKNLESLTSLKGVEAKDITQEQIDAVNAELIEAGITGIETSALGTVKGLNDQLVNLTKEKTDLEASLKASESKVSGLEAKVEELGGKPAADKQETVVPKDKITEDKDVVSFENSHSVKIAENFFN